MAKRKIYISGVISGLEHSVALANFSRAQKNWEAIGYQVVNPMTLTHDHDKTWEAYMKEDLKALFDCSEIYMLKNWHYSNGANIEYNLARELGIKINFE